MEDIEEIIDCELKADKINELINLENCDQLQLEKYKFLSKLVSKGQNVDEWWKHLVQILICEYSKFKTT